MIGCNIQYVHSVTVKTSKALQNCGDVITRDIEIQMTTGQRVVITLFSDGAHEIIIEESNHE